MKLASANYVRFLTHSNASKKLSNQYLQQMSVHERIIMLHSRLINEMYEEIEKAASEGQYCVKIRPTHLFWQTPSVQGYFGDKGFHMNAETNTIQWCQELK